MMVTYQKSKFETAETPANPGTQKSPFAAYASKSGANKVDKTFILHAKK